ncbi:hypothetical protein WMY93_032418 [Mugilogobius chulae]|uniref:Uncharacterized protein n=1 Tax=Mugilogobius chulae TaxID=88201 RepID=A0AAW0MP33_9GOBI
MAKGSREIPNISPNKPRPAYLADVPEYLLRVKALLPKKRRRRGVHGGRLVRLKSWLVLSPELLDPANIPQDYAACYRRFLARRKLAPAVIAATWLQPVCGPWDNPMPVRLRRSGLRDLGGVNPANLGH